MIEKHLSILREVEVSVFCLRAIPAECRCQPGALEALPMCHEDWSQGTGKMKPVTSVALSRVGSPSLAGVFCVCRAKAVNEGEVWLRGWHSHVARSVLLDRETRAPCWNRRFSKTMQKLQDWPVVRQSRKDTGAPAFPRKGAKSQWNFRRPWRVKLAARVEDAFCLATPLTTTPDHEF